jgi:hypothetical protein
VIPLKNDFTYAILDYEGRAIPGTVLAAGLYRHDTRHLSRYDWRFGNLELIHREADARGLRQFWSKMERHLQVLLVARRLELTPTGLVEHLILENSDNKAREIDISVALEADFADIFAVRWGQPDAVPQPVLPTASGFRYVAADGVVSETRIDWDGLDLTRPIILAPGESRRHTVRIDFVTDLPAAADPPAAAPGWSPRLDVAALPAAEQPVVRQALSWCRSAATR